MILPLGHNRSIRAAARARSRSHQASAFGRSYSALDLSVLEISKIATACECRRCAGEVSRPRCSRAAGAWPAQRWRAGRPAHLTQGYVCVCRGSNSRIISTLRGTSRPCRAVPCPAVSPSRSLWMGRFAYSLSPHPSIPHAPESSIGVLNRALCCCCFFVDRGKYATVRRCRCRSTGQQYAAKVVRKRRRSSDLRAEILHEVAVLDACRGCPRIVRLHRVFESANDMVLLLEL